MLKKSIFWVAFGLVFVLHAWILQRHITPQTPPKAKKELTQAIAIKSVVIQKPKKIEPPKPKPKKITPKPKKRPKRKKVPKKAIPKPKPKKIEPIKEEPKEAVPKEIVTKKPTTAPKKVAPPKLSKSELRAIKEGYIAKLRQAIERHKKYPRIAKRLKQEGEVEIFFRVLKSGKIVSVALLQKSGYKRLDSEALRSVQSVGIFEAIPKELGIEHLELSVPITFRLKRG